jgi:hypothetical protein
LIFSNKEFDLMDWEMQTTLVVHRKRGALGFMVHPALSWVMVQLLVKGTPNRCNLRQNRWAFSNQFI